MQRFEKEEIWTGEDESELRRLVDKRVNSVKGRKGYDLKFAEAILAGEKGERAVIEAFAKGEVKTVFQTGNPKSRHFKTVFVEHTNYGKPSGINASDAEWFHFVLQGQEFKGEVIISIKTDRLKELVSPMMYAPPAGDRKASIGKRVRLEDFLRTRTVIDKLKI